MLTHDKFGVKILAPSLMWLEKLKACGLMWQGADILAHMTLQDKHDENTIWIVALCDTFKLTPQS